MSLPYTSLDASQAQIRVLVVHPPSNDPSLSVRCTLKVVSLDSKPKFAALSYVWGDPKITKAISVNNIEILVTKNLHDSLEWFSNHAEGTLSPCLEQRVIWADAICINQNDLAEKAHQINLMSRIYKDANTVLCWLGQSPTPLINTYLKRRTTLARPITSPRWKRLVSWTVFLAKSWYHNGSRIGAVQESLEIIGGQAEFLQLEYSTRMWTFQEVLIPSSNKVFAVLDGAIVPNFEPRKIEVITFPSLVIAIMIDLAQQEPERLSEAEKQAVWLFQSRAVAKADSVLGKAVWRQMWLGEHDLATNTAELQEHVGDHGNGKLQLWELLLATADRLCYDPRDKIFALLGLLKDRNPAFPMQGGEELLAVDYTKTPERVVLDALYYMYKHETPALVLFICTQYKPQWWTGEITAGIPSWLPDLSKPRSTVFNRLELPGSMWEDGHFQWTRGEHGKDDYVSFQARCISQIAVVCSFVGNTLEIINKVAQIVHRAKTYMHPSPIGASETTNTAPRSVDQAPSTALTGQNEVNMEIRSVVSRLRLDANTPKRLTHALIGNGDKNMTFASKVAQYGTEIWTILQQAAQKSESGYCLTLEERTALIFGDLIAENLQGRALIVLEDGRFGICADLARVRDIVFLSSSFRNTVVLRPVGSQATRGHGSGELSCANAGDEQGGNDSGLRDHGTFTFVDHVLIDAFRVSGHTYKVLSGELSELDCGKVALV